MALHFGDHTDPRWNEVAPNYQNGGLLLVGLGFLVMADPGTLGGMTTCSMGNVGGVVPCGVLVGPSFGRSRIMRKGCYGFEKKKNREGEYTMEKATAVHVPGWPACRGRCHGRFEQLDVYRSTERAESAGAEPMDDDVWKSRRTGPRRQRQQGARGNSKTDRYSNVTSLELNYTQGEAHGRHPKRAARSFAFICEL